jgi:hypothetical protein
LRFSGAAPGHQPDDKPDYTNNQKYSHPDSCLEDISDDLTASQGQIEKEQKGKQGESVFRRERAKQVVHGTLLKVAKTANQAMPDGHIR